MKLAVTAALVILVALPIPLDAQSAEEGVRAIESKLLEVPSAAFKLTASRNGRGYELNNNSAFTVAQMQLGCAKKKGGTIKILTVRPRKDIDLAPGGFVFWQANHGFFPDEACKKGKLALIEIKFANGTQWKLSP